MPWNVRDAGVWRTVTAPHVRVAGTWQPVQSGWVRVAGVWQQFYSGLSLTIGNVNGASNTTYDPPFITSANISLFLFNDGTWRIDNDFGVQGTGNWCSPANTTNAALFEVSSSVLSASGGTWSHPGATYVPLSTGRAYSFQIPGPNSGSGTLSITIRRIGSGSPSTTFSFDASGSCFP